MKNMTASMEEKPKKVLDTTGLYCPEPIFRLRTAVDEMEDGEILKLLADDPAALEDVKRWAKRTRNKIMEIKKEGFVLTFIIKKTENMVMNPNVNIY